MIMLNSQGYAIRKVRKAHPHNGQNIEIMLKYYKIIVK